MRIGSVEPQEYCYNPVAIYKENKDHWYSIYLCTHSYIKYTVKTHISISKETVVYGA